MAKDVIIFDVYAHLCNWFQYFFLLETASTHSDLLRSISRISWDGFRLSP